MFSLLLLVAAVQSYGELGSLRANTMPVICACNSSARLQDSNNDDRRDVSRKRKRSRVNLMGRAQDRFRTGTKGVAMIVSF